MSYDQTQDPAQQSNGAAPNMGDEAPLEFDPAFVSGEKKPVNRSAMVLVGLLLVGAIVVYFMYFRHPPAPAAADSVSNKKYEDVANFDASKINLMKQTLKDTEQVVKKFQTYPSQTQVPLTALHANPFRELTPRPEIPGGPVVDNRSEELEHAKVQEAVAELKLQSVIAGKRPACMINNTFYRQGDHIGILTLETISAHSVVVSKGKWSFELPVSK